jgi:NTE family protein
VGADIHIPREQKKTINVALQGGGAHGAFTWGVLERLAQDHRLFMTGFSGTSAGAMNGVVFVDGFIKGSRQGAIEAMNEFWRRTSAAADVWNPFRQSSLDKYFGTWNLDGQPHYVFFDLITRLMSPYELNPFNINPLREILAELVDFPALRAREDIRVFVTATNVETNKARVFESREITVDVLMASACLPFMFQAVEVDGQHYWDGGYIGNPAIYPLIHQTDCDDLVIIQVNPINRRGVPRTSREILNRLNEISFNATLMREMRAIATVTKMIDEGIVHDPRYRRLRVHVIEAEAEMADLGASSKLNPDWDFLRYLHDIGYRAANAWLEKHFDELGVRSTVDIFEKYL